MAQNKPRYVSTFRAPTEYERQLEEARRRAALAEALAQQEYQPMEGAAAPIPRAAPLVKALQGYLTAREGRMAKEAATEAEKAGRKEFTDYIRSFEPEQQTVGMGQIAAMEATAPQIDAQGRVTYNPPSAIAAPNQRLVATSPDQPMQMQVGGPLTTAQKRARALEGFESTNPMVQQFAMAQYEKTMPRDLDLKIAPINPTEVDLGSVAEAQRTGDISKIKPRVRPAETPAPTPLAKLFAERDALPPNDPRIPIYNAAINAETQGKGTRVDVRYGAPVAGVNAQGNPVFFQPDPAGGPPRIISGVAPKPEAPGTEEAKSALFADRMSEAAPLLDILPAPSIGASAKGQVPGVGNVLLSPQNRRFNQAALNFITAVARKESGANIPEPEIATMTKTYIPVAGDDAQTLEQKRRSRESALRGIALSAGPQYKLAPINPPPGVDPQVWAELTLEERRKFAK